MYLRALPGEKDMPVPAIQDPLVWLAIAGVIYILLVTPTTVRLLRS